MPKPHLNWYGQTLAEYQKPSCVYCLADVAHKFHMSQLEAEQLGLADIVPQEPRSLFLQEVCDQGGFAAIAAREAIDPAA